MCILQQNFLLSPRPKSLDLWDDQVLDWETLKTTSLKELTENQSYISQRLYDVIKVCVCVCACVCVCERVCLSETMWVH